MAEVHRQIQNQLEEMVSLASSDHSWVQGADAGGQGGKTPVEELATCFGHVPMWDSPIVLWPYLKAEIGPGLWALAAGHTSHAEQPGDRRTWEQCAGWPQEPALPGPSAWWDGPGCWFPLDCPDYLLGCWVDASGPRRGLLRSSSSHSGPGAARSSLPHTGQWGRQADGWSSGNVDL